MNRIISIILFSMMLACVAGATPPTDPKDRLCGDVNGDGAVTLADAIILKRALILGNQPATNLMVTENCDVGGQVGCTAEDGDIILNTLIAPQIEPTIQFQCRFN